MTDQSRLVEMTAAVQDSALAAAVRAARRFRAAMLPGRTLNSGHTDQSQLFGGTADQVRAVREFVRSRCAGHPAVTDAILVASELATNAITHSASGREDGVFMVHVSDIGAEHIALVVTDQGGTDVPHEVNTDQDCESGRGLAVADSLTCLLTWFGDRHLRSVLAIVPDIPPAHILAR